MHAGESAGAGGTGDRRAGRLLWVHALFALGDGLSGVFLPLYLWQESASVRATLLWQLAVVGGLLALAVAAPGAVRRWGAGQLQTCGIAGYALFYLTVLVLGGWAVQHVIVLGLLRGAAMGAYYIAKNVLTYDAAGDRSRDRFLARYGALNSIGYLVAPPLAGWLIALMGARGYTVVFAVSLAVMGCAGLIALPIRAEVRGESRGVRRALAAPNPLWRRYLASLALIGMRDGLSDFLVGLLLAITLANTGIYGSLVAVCDLAGLLVFAGLSVRVSRRRRLHLFRWGGAALALSSLVLLGRQSAGTLFAFLLLIRMLYPLWNIPFFASAMRSVEAADPDLSQYVELTAASEIPLNTGRALSIGVFLVLNAVRGEGGAWIRGMLAALGLAYPLVAALMAPAAEGRAD